MKEAILSKSAVFVTWPRILKSSRLKVRKRSTIQARPIILLLVGTLACRGDPGTASGWPGTGRSHAGC